jgi:hypothetical protein
MGAGNYFIRIEIKLQVSENIVDGLESATVRIPM